MENGPIAKKRCFSESYAPSWGSHPRHRPRGKEEAEEPLHASKEKWGLVLTSALTRAGGPVPPLTKGATTGDLSPLQKMADNRTGPKSGKTPSWTTKRSSRNPLSFSLFACFLSIHKSIVLGCFKPGKNTLTDLAHHAFIHTMCYYQSTSNLFLLTVLFLLNLLSPRTISD